MTPRSVGFHFVSGDGDVDKPTHVSGLGRGRRLPALYAGGLPPLFLRASVASVDGTPKLIIFSANDRSLALDNNNAFRFVVVPNSHVQINP
jgi:hypothetical protein